MMLCSFNGLQCSHYMTWIYMHWPGKDVNVILFVILLYKPVTK